MPTLVSIENETCWLRRYVAAGTKIRKTHSCDMGGYRKLRADVVQQFRLNPPELFRVDGYSPSDEAA